MKNKKIILLIFLIILSTGIYIFYFHFYITPRYTIFEIYNAIQNSDQEKFLKYVDLDSVLDNLLDQIIAMSKKENESITDKMKSEVIIFFLQNSKDMLKEKSKEYFLSSLFKKSPQDEKNLILFKYMNLNRMNLIVYYSKLQILSLIQEIEYKNPNIAMMKFKIRNLPKTLEALFIKEKNSHWKLKTLPNLIDIYSH